jgi:hypothetical protein
MRISLFLLLSALLLSVPPACAPPAPATSPPPRDAVYARTPGDTLRYRERTESVSSDGLAGMRASAGTRYRRDARLAIAFMDGDSARAWFEAVRLETTGGGEAREVQSAGPDVVGLPFVLAVGPRGIDSTVSAPLFPASWDGLQGQFNGFFPRLPGGVLAPGREWEDTGAREGTDSVFRTRYSWNASYRVVGDSTIGGVPVVSVQYESFSREARIGRSAEDPSRPTYLPPYEDQTDRVVHGRFYFAAGTGRLVLQTWAGARDFSRTSFVGAEAAVQHTEFSGRRELISNPRR